MKESVSLAGALWRGFKLRCPKCGQGKLFGRFLKVSAHCPSCGEEMFHHRADDFPAYLVVLVVGHVIVASVVVVELFFAPPMWLEFLVWLPATFVSALVLLQPTKGAVVGLQWRLGMHGFEQAKLRQSGLAHAEL